MTPFARQLLTWLFGERSDRDDELPDTEQLISDFTFMRKQGAPGIPANVRQAVGEALGELLEAGRVEEIGGRWKWRPERAKARAVAQGRMF